MERAAILESDLAMTEISLSTDSLADYRRFIQVRQLPSYRITGHTATFPDEYAERLLGVKPPLQKSKYKPAEYLFDYQRAIAAVAAQKRKYAVFADCGLGKTAILLEFARHCAEVLPKGKAVLILSPLMVVPQTIEESGRFYGDALPIDHVKSSDLNQWLKKGGRIGITNYEALRDEVEQGRLGALIADESSLMKSHYGKYGNEVIRLGAGLEYKLALTGTPAPNDRIEYANHACFLDGFKTTNEFLAKYFVNRGQTDNRWEIRPHALKPFYRDLSHWCIFLTNPAVYGWKDNCGTIPPINVSIDHVDLTATQNKQIQSMTGGLFAKNAGGITTRGKLSRISKSGDSLKPQFIRDLADSWPDKSTIIWCKYNDEQDRLAEMFPDAGNISGDTPYESRLKIIDAFKRRELKTLISKPKILGFGLNLQVCTKMIFSGLEDSYESYYQAVKRANRINSTEALDVHIPVTEVEYPMIQTVLEKADRVQHDAAEQEKLFSESRYG